MKPAGMIPGFVQWFRIGEHTTVESSIASLEALGVQRLRTHLSWADYHADGRPRMVYVAPAPAR